VHERLRAHLRAQEQGKRVWARRGRESRDESMREQDGGIRRM
jgi:hypothetical protein